MRRLFLSVVCTSFLLTGSPNLPAVEQAAESSGDSSADGKLLFFDDFNRAESAPDREDVGEGWSTNSRTRAKGKKQVHLDGSAMHAARHEVADHGVSVVHDLGFRDGKIGLRFKLGPKDDLGINIADMNEKSVHAGHLCMARIRLKQVELIDLKTGRMDLKMRTARTENTITPEQEARLKTKVKTFDVDLTADQWYQLSVEIAGDVMRVSIDGDLVGEFQSPGIAHPNKQRLRLAVGRSAWIDDVGAWSRDHL